MPRAPHAPPPLPEPALALVALRDAESPRAALDWAREAGFRHASLDGGAPGLRARELSRSARRDLASLLRRLELGFAGIDLWIPPAHFAEPANADRAVGAVCEALELASELHRLHPGAGGAPAVSLTLPGAGAEAAVEALEARAQACGALIADHAHPGATRALAHVLVGVDPEIVLRAGADPAGIVSSAPPGSVVAARLSAWPPAPARSARFDALAYAIALVTAGYRRPIVIDTRDSPDPRLGASGALAAWKSLIPMGH